MVVGTAGAGDIALTLGEDTLPAEGYRLTVAASVTVRAGTTAGAFYGTRTLLQLLHRSATVPGGTAVDRPAKAERGLMIDQGRKYFTVDWVKQHIKELAYLKLNYFHFHLSDTYGFRLESSTHPEIVSAEHYSKQDIADLVALGLKYHVTIVPEIDTPGHMNPILAAHPELALRNSSGTADPAFIDLSKPGAYTLIGDLINEYLPPVPRPLLAHRRRRVRRRLQPLPAAARLRPRPLRRERDRQGHLLRLRQLVRRAGAGRRQDHPDVERRHQGR